MLWGCFGCLISTEMSLKFCLKLDKRSLPEKMNQVRWMGNEREGRGFWFLQFNIVELIIFDINTFTFQFLKQQLIEKMKSNYQVEIGRLTNFKKQMTLVQPMQQKEVSCQQMVFSYFADQTPQGVQKQRNCHNSQRMKLCNHTFVGSCVHWCMSARVTRTFVLCNGKKKMQVWIQVTLQHDIQPTVYGYMMEKIPIPWSLDPPLEGFEKRRAFGFSKSPVGSGYQGRWIINSPKQANNLGETSLITWPNSTNSPFY